MPLYVSVPRCYPDWAAAEAEVLEHGRRYYQGLQLAYGLYITWCKDVIAPLSFEWVLPFDNVGESVGVGELRTSDTAGLGSWVGERWEVGNGEEREVGERGEMGGGEKEREESRVMRESWPGERLSLIQRE